MSDTGTYAGMAILGIIALVGILWAFGVFSSKPSTSTSTSNSTVSPYGTMNPRDLAHFTLNPNPSPANTPVATYLPKVNGDEITDPTVKALLATMNNRVSGVASSPFPANNTSMAWLYGDWTVDVGGIHRPTFTTITFFSNGSSRGHQLGDGPFTAQEATFGTDPHTITKVSENQVIFSRQVDPGRYFYQTYRRGAATATMGPYAR